jgi:predicted TIM-barrel fold metal-dependent hydrolase
MKVDFHSHYYPKKYVEKLDRIKDSSAGQTVYLPRFYKLMWDLTKRLGHMKKLGIGMQVLSLANPWTDAFDPETATKLATEVNEEIASIVSKDSDHFIGLGTLPLRSVDNSLLELDKLKSLGLKGVCIGTRVGRTPISDPLFRPVLKKIESLNLVLFLHPSAPPPSEGTADYGLIPTVVFPSETALMLTRLIFTGAFDEMPRLKLVAGHLGGTVPFLVERIVASTDGFYYIDFNPVREAGVKLRASPKLLLSRIYADAISYSTPALQCALDIWSSNHLLYGTDYPLTMGKPWNIAKSIQGLKLSKKEMDGIFEKNALKLLGA